MSNISKITVGETTYDIKDLNAVSNDLLKSTVGWTGKNLFTPNQTGTTNNGITYTTNSDKTVTLNGTATAESRFDYLTGNATDVERNYLTNGKYILSGTPAGTSGNTYWMYINIHKVSDGTFKRNIMANSGENEVPFTISNDEYVSSLVIKVASGQTINNVVFSPMIRDASITDDTYEPYHESVEEEIEQIYADNGVLGAKNVGWYAKGVIGSGGGAGEFRFDSSYNGSSLIAKLEPNTEYIVTKASGQGDRFRVVIFKNKPTTTATSEALEVIPNDSSKTKDSFNSGNYGYAVFTYSVSGEITQDTAKAMLRLASDTDDTYVPYAMTNRELTDAVTPIESAVTDIIEGATVGDIGNYLYKQGNIVWLTLRLQGVTTTAWASTPIGMIPDGFRPRKNLRIINSGATGSLQPIQINAAGTIFSAVNLTDQTVILTATWITN